jgi:hypothetical protein
MTGPFAKVGQYLLGILGLVLALRLINHVWPSPLLLGVVAGGSYYLWNSHRRLEENAQIDSFRRERRGKYGPRRSRD